MNIHEAVTNFRKGTDQNHRYSSYDYCYNYFYKCGNEILVDKEKSCAILGFYLASWGMMRGSSFLLQRSYHNYIPLLEYTSKQDESTWDIDVHNYSENYDRILKMYKDIKDLIIPNNKRHIVLVTKIMLGVFGIVPAFDEYFCKTFRELDGPKSKFRALNQKSLEVIEKFYQDNDTEINKLSEVIKTIDFKSGNTKHHYTKAKIIDMFGFNKGINRNLLCGNGININYTGTQYTNKSIITRSKEFIEDVPAKVNIIETLELFKKLFKEMTSVLSGDYDQYTYSDNEKKTLLYLKKRYSNIKNDFEIGFEDYLFMYELFCKKQKIQNSQLYDARELLKRFFLDGIYNKGEIQGTHQCYSNKFKNFLSNFNTIFTTNYDRNIEIAIDKNVNYLHGAFHIFADEYDSSSVFNKVGEARNVDKVVKGYEYLFSNALSDYSGEQKKASIDFAQSANSGFSKLASHYKKNPASRDGCAELIREFDNPVAKIIEYMDKNEGESVSNEYPIAKFKQMFGHLTILGLSPYNDNHIFTMINDNDDISEVNYYYYEENEMQDVKEILSNHKVIFKDVRSFWDRLDK